MPPTMTIPAEHILLTRVVYTFADPQIVYLTRDSDDETGELYNYVEIWPAVPHRTRAENGKGACWLGADPSKPDVNVEVMQPLGRYTLDAVRKAHRTLPETDRECVKVER